ncbi:lipoprotein [Spiroplasma endosymbiont of Panorpa germanica]|uniref:lipoprotein n=1 Tax=Spiroplasma endosymbiont of Panorpa germanica TaxID=3066314 RepID=UPI0030D278D9
MKKLLSILASSSLVGTTTLAVVACKTQEEIIPNDFDFEKTLNEFLSEVTSIFKTAIYEAFYPYAWMEEENLPANITIEELINNREALNDHNSDYYKNVSAEIFKIIPTKDINNEIVRSTVNNINYNSVIVDNSTPLKSGIDIEKIELYEKGDNLTVGISIATQITYKDSTGQKGYRPVTTMVSINIFKKPEVVEKAIDISEEFNKSFNKLHVNDFVFNSSKGNLENTTAKLNEGKYPVNADIKKYLVELSDANPKAEINNMGLKWSVDTSTIIDASRFATASNLYNYKGRLNNALLAHKGLEDPWIDYLDQVKSDTSGSNWLVPIIAEGINDQYIEDMEYEIQAKNNISRSINQYNLAYNFDNSTTIQNFVSAQDSDLKLDMVKDANTIAMFGLTFKGVTFKLDGDTYDFLDQTIFYRQRTTFNNTKELYEKFIEDSFEFQSQFLGLRNKESVENLGNKNFYIKIEEKYREENYTGTSTMYLNARDKFKYLVRVNENANNYLEELELTPVLINSNEKGSPMYYNYGDTKKNYWGPSEKDAVRTLFIHNGGKTKINDICLKTYFFSSGVTNPSKLSYWVQQKGSRKNGEVKIKEKDWKKYLKQNETFIICEYIKDIG